MRLKGLLAAIPPNALKQALHLHADAGLEVFSILLWVVSMYVRIEDSEQVRASRVSPAK
jgi:hypothetical protein